MIPMAQTAQRLTARLICVPAAIVVGSCAGLLVAGYVDASRRAPIDKNRLETLEGMAKEDPSQTPVLAEERERQREASLERAACTRSTAYILIVAAVGFLIAAKWSISLNGRRPPNPVVIATADGSRRLEPRALARANPPPPRPPGRSNVSTVPCRAHPPAPPDLSFVDETIDVCGGGREAVIPILQAIQLHERYLPEDSLKRVCERTRITPAQITGVSSFYRKFRHAPVGEHIIKVCHGTACHVAGAGNITDEIRRTLGIGPGTDTDPNRQFTIEEVACLGCCTLAPVVQIDQVTYGHLTLEKVAEMLHDSLEATKRGTVRDGRGTGVYSRGDNATIAEIRVGLGSCCVAGGSGKVYEALEDAVKATGARVRIKRVGCVGMCHQTPLVDVALPGKPSSFYAGVSPEDAKSIVRRHFRPVGIARRIADTASSWLEDVAWDGRREAITRRAIDVRDPPVAAFLGKQKHIATEHFGHLDPADLDEYLDHDGFGALRRCAFEMTPQAVIDEIGRSGLRGRGGAGYPTGHKWAKVRDAVGRRASPAGKPTCYVICNGDEGDPGAFMDRMLMESFPYRVIEGMAIAAYAVGACEGYFYIRAEYPLAVRRIRDALRQCEDRGLLGGEASDGGLNLTLTVMQGAGAFVCGEETALLGSIEGNRGSPRLRPPYPADRGLWAVPTLVNNVETYATVPWIMRNGSAAFAEIGTAQSKGTKVFALAGKVKRGGLIEVPMGVTIGDIVCDIGGGTKEGRPFKAVQIGGPSGGCVPARLADTPVDYEALSRVGAIMGSGGLVVLDESDCMVDLARYFLGFTQDQSCGKCTYCRIGTRRMLDILNRLCDGAGRKDDVDLLETLGNTILAGSLCGLGRTAPNPVLSTLRYFREEYEAHIDGRCPAGKCKSLISYHATDKCIGCTLCAQGCPADAIAFTPYQRHEIDNDKCTCCDICRSGCPEEAIEVK